MSGFPHKDAQRVEPCKQRTVLPLWEKLEKNKWNINKGGTENESNRKQGIKRR